MNIYTKLSTGDWGVLCETRPSVGDVVTVTKRDKTTKQETIAEVFTRGGKFACAVVTEHGGKCDECGRYTHTRRRRYDSSGILGMCCAKCARTPSYELSFG